MSLANHYALLIAINRYPGLLNLEGPENDAHAFREWLLDPDGGDLEPANVRLICSTDFQPPADNPYDANPTEREFVRALDKWLRVDGGWHDKVGARLYLFFAGHGFTAGSSISDPALYTAAAQNGDPVHIAGYRYAAKIANGGFFDEVVLLMDCCQDVLKASQVLEPTWSPPDRGQSAMVKFLQAYGAPRGRKAFEDALDEGGKKRGLFSSVWLESLRSAAADGEGWVTGRAVKEQALQIWARRFKARTNYDPPIRLPDGEDIRLYQRRADAPLPTVQVDVSELIARGGEALETIGRVRRARKVRGHAESFAHAESPVGEYQLDALQRECTAIRPGLYALKGEKQNLVVEVLPRVGAEPVKATASQAVTVGSPGALSVPEMLESAGEQTIVSLATADPGLDIVVVDASFNKVGSGTDTLSLALPPGLYKALVTAPGALSETIIRVENQSMSRRLPPVIFSSAAPLNGTTTTHEYQHYPAIAASEGLSEPIGVGGEILIFARDSSHRQDAAPISAPYPWDSLRLVGLDREFDLPLDLATRTHGVAGYAYRKLAVAAGSYLVIVENTQKTTSYETGVLVPVVPGWRTEVYLDCVDENRVDPEGASLAARALDPGSAAIFLTRSGAPTPLAKESGRAGDIGRLFLTSGRPATVPDAQLAAEAPLTAILAAYANATTRSLSTDVSRRRVRECLEVLPAEIRGTLPDAVILDAWSSGSDAQQPDLPAVLLPAVALGWKLLQQVPKHAPSNRWAVEAVGQWRLAGSVWTHVRLPATKARSLRQKLYRLGTRTGNEQEMAEANRTLTPPWTPEAWTPALPGLRLPDPEHSPFQQALRRRVIDGIEREDPAGTPVFDLGAAFGIDTSLAVEAYREVFDRASQAAANRA